MIVDDEAAQMRALCETLRDHGYETVGFGSANAALGAIAEGKFDLILSDLMMPEMDGIGFLRAAQRQDPELVGIIMTGHGTIDTAVEAMKVGALDYILKPFKLSVILPVLSRALAMRRLRAENAELARCVRRRTQELEAANRELEAFSYSVSHDLRAPLRAVDGYSRLLQDQFGPQLPAEAQRLVQTVRDSGQRMAGLIEALLRLSRLGRQPLERRPVELAALVRDGVEELRREQGDRAVDVRVGPLPDCVGDPTLLRQVVINLLSNAFKYTRRTPEPVVEVGTRTEAGEAAYFVRDNGAGFDMSQAHRLGVVFQRLHGEHEFEGTGVGLALVQRIVQRHGGRLWAQGAVGRGATFFFTLGEAGGTPMNRSRTVASPGATASGDDAGSTGAARSRCSSTRQMGAPAGAAEADNP